MNIDQVLEDLDKHATELNFPVLDNAYVELAAARLSAFQSTGDWLIVFEVLGFSSREIQFVDDLYAYGSCVEREGFIGEEICVTSASEAPLFDPRSCRFIADWRRWSIRVGEQKMSFSPTAEEYARAGIAIDRDTGQGTFNEIALLRFLVHHLGEERLFMSERFLLSHFPKCGKLSKFIRTTEWQHPDVADGEKPSRNISMRTLVEALSGREPLLFNQGRPNTHWRFWADGWPTSDH
jgi:hypothetical protein